MRLGLMKFAAAALAVMSTSLVALAQPASAASFATISGAGSTWSYNAIHSWITSVAAFGMQVNYSPLGSTAGRQQFKQDTVNFAASEIPYGLQDGTSTDPPPTRGFAYMPDTAGATTFMYNLHIGGAQVSNLRLSGAVIAGIFTNKITRWNDPAIAADNPGLTLPAEAITPVVRTDGSGSTFQFTQWMLATQASSWTAYCQVVGRNPCTPTSAYPVQPGTAMIGQSGDLGVSGYVSQSGAEGAIGYTEYSFALPTGFPVAKVLNAAGYYTEPTPGHVGVSLLKAQLNSDQTQNLSGVYTDTDPRTYELSSYSYLIVPTDTAGNLSSDQGYTLGAFGSYLLCQGQQQVDQLGYSALPINLVEAGLAQLQKIPGNQVPTAPTDFIKSCNNPTFAPDGTNLLADNDPQPPACDKQGTTQCSAAALTTVALTASPNPAQVGQLVTLTATETASDGSHPAGSIRFSADSTAIGAPVTVDPGGKATTTITFTAPGGQTLMAEFIPADPAAIGGSTGTFTETVQPQTISGTEPVTVTVPTSGTFTFTVAPGTVTLTVSGASATGALNAVTVDDTRNTFPGWSVSGQAADFTGSGTAAGSTISGNELGWAPIGTLAPSAVLGAQVTPGSPGLGTTAAILASAHAGNGFGTSTLAATLALAIPATARAGDYVSLLTLTAVTSLP